MNPRAYPSGVPCWISLATPDVDASSRFSGELFGWEVQESPSTTLPARATWSHGSGARCLADFDIPDTGTMAQCADLERPAHHGRGECPPLLLGGHRLAAFAVADTDAIARRVVELGGRVGVPAFAVGDARLAVLRDHSAAAFTASHYHPGS